MNWVFILASVTSVCVLGGVIAAVATFKHKVSCYYMERAGEMGWITNKLTEEARCRDFTRLYRENLKSGEQ